ncbi:MAG: hypothetical protein ACR2NC_05300 [Thermodesulfobacteriota bacterium]
MEPVNLTFGIESSTGLWNKIFEGFDQDTVLTSRFEGDSPRTIEVLYKLGSMVNSKFKNCTIETRDYGIIIKRAIDDKDQNQVNDWMELMKSIKSEIVNLDY